MIILNRLFTIWDSVRFVERAALLHTLKGSPYLKEVVKTGDLWHVLLSAKTMPLYCASALSAAIVDVAGAYFCDPIRFQFVTVGIHTVDHITGAHRFMKITKPGTRFINMAGFVDLARAAAEAWWRLFHDERTAILGIAVLVYAPRDNRGRQPRRLRLRMQYPPLSLARKKTQGKLDDA